MISFNYDLKEINTKIVYYGPGLCGKTTNLQKIYNNIPENSREKMISLATKTDRTLFFDFLPLKLGSIGGYHTRFHLYTVPGQVFYNSTRKVVLTGVDAIVFVADSEAHRLEANIQSFENLQDNLAEKGLSLEEIPYVLQYNKRDCPNILSVEKLNSVFNKGNAPYFEAIAITGAGVFDTLKGISQLMLNEFYKRGSFAKLGLEPRRKPRKKADIEKEKEDIWKSNLDNEDETSETKIEETISSQDELPATDVPDMPTMDDSTKTGELPSIDTDAIPEMPSIDTDSVPEMPSIDTDSDSIPDMDTSHLPTIEDKIPPTTDHLFSEPPDDDNDKTSTEVTATLDLPGKDATSEEDSTPTQLREMRKKIRVPVKIALEKIPQRLIFEIKLEIELK